MKVDIKGAAAPFQQNIDQYASNARLNQALGGLLQGIQSQRQFKLNQGRLGGFQQALQAQADDYTNALKNPKLSLDDKLALEDSLSRLRMLDATTDVTNIDQQLGAYQKMYSPMSDPRALSNALKVAHITGQYKVGAAKEYGKSQPKILFGGVGDITGGSPAPTGEPLEALLLKLLSGE